MELTAHEIAQMFNGRIEGNPACKITTLSKIEEGSEDALSFLANPRYEPYLYSTRSAVVLVPENLLITQEVLCTLIYVQDPYTAFSVLLDKFNPPLYASKSGVELPSFADPSVILPEEIYLGAFSYLGKGVQLGRGVKVYPHVYVGDNVTVGENCILFPGVKIYENCVLGNRVIIHAGSIIGADGFGFAPQLDGTFKKINQTGNVIIDDDVEIGANCTVDRATVGSTRIRQGVKLDNLIQIAHNVEIGANTVIAAQTGISGSTKLGENCLLGGQVGIAGHITLAAGTQIGAQSGIGKSTSKTNLKFRGSPVQPYQDALRSEVIYRHLPELEKRVTRLESAKGLNAKDD